MIRKNCLESPYNFPWALSCAFWKIAWTIAPKYAPFDFIWLFSLQTKSGFTYTCCTICSKSVLFFSLMKFSLSILYVSLWKIANFLITQVYEDILKDITIFRKPSWWHYQNQNSTFNYFADWAWCFLLAIKISTILVKIILTIFILQHDIFEYGSWLLMSYWCRLIKPLNSIEGANKVLLCLISI